MAVNVLYHRLASTLVPALLFNTDKPAQIITRVVERFCSKLLKIYFRFSLISFSTFTFFKFPKIMSLDDRTCLKKEK